MDVWICFTLQLVAWKRNRIHLYFWIYVLLTTCLTYYYHTLLTKSGPRSYYYYYYYAYMYIVPRYTTTEKGIFYRSTYLST